MKISKEIVAIGLLILSFFVVVFLFSSTDDYYTDDTYLDAIIFELSRDAGYYNVIFGYVPVDNVIVHYDNEIYVFDNVTKFYDSYNPYFNRDICDEYCSFQWEDHKQIIYQCPAEDGDMEYYDNNNTLVYWIDDRFFFDISEETGGFIIR